MQLTITGGTSPVGAARSTDDAGDDDEICVDDDGGDEKEGEAM